MRLFRILLAVQAAYTFLTGLWPIIDIDSFMDVTGYKTDEWLVKTVGALLLPVSLCMIFHVFIRTDHRPAVVLASLTALAFVCIDFYYAINDIISDIYLADGVVELIFLILWGIIIYSKRYSIESR